MIEFVELEKDENIVPLKYEVYNSKNKLICTQLSSKQNIYRRTSLKELWFITK